MIGSDKMDPTPVSACTFPRLSAMFHVTPDVAMPRLTLVIAPAGYGKSLLLRQWVDSISDTTQTVIVVNSCSKTGDSNLMVQHVNGDAAITEQVSSLLDVLTTTDDAMQLRLMRSDLFASIACNTTQCIIAIDDLDHLPPASSKFLLEDLLADLESPANLIVVAAGRLPTHHSLGHLAAAGHIRQVFARDLVLTAPEVAKLLAMQGHVESSSDILNAVIDATCGWPAGIALAGHLIGYDEEPGQWIPLDDYVARTIGDSLSDETRQLVLVTAAFPWLDEDLWQALVADVPARVDSFDTLRAIVPMTRGPERSDGRRPYHFAPILRSSFRRLHGIRTHTTTAPLSEKIAIHSATSWYTKHSMFSEAISLASETGEWDYTLAAMVLPCRELAIRDDHPALIGLLNTIPDEQLLSQDDLAFWYVLSLLSVGDVSEGTRLHARIHSAWVDSINPLRRGRILVLDALLAIWQGNREGAHRRSVEALSILPTDSYHERMRAAATAEVLSTHLGQRETAIRMFDIARSARRYLPWDQRWWATFVLPNQADRIALEGNLSSAYKQFEHLVESYSDAYPELIALVYMRLALIELEWGTLEIAIERFERIVPLSTVGYWMQEVPLAHAKVLHALKRDDEAKKLLYAAIREANSDLNEIDLRRSRTVLAQIWLDRGEVDLAETWAVEETLSLDFWPRSIGQTVPGLVMAHLQICRGEWASSIRLLDAVIAEGERRRQSSPLVRAFAMKALAHALSGDVIGCHGAIRIAIDLGDPSGFQSSYMVGGFDTRSLLGTPEWTLRTASVFASPSASRSTLSLTKRERDVLRFAMQGLTNTEIAGRLFISPVTVKNHLARIYRRLGVHNRDEAIIAARSQELI